MEKRDAPQDAGQQKAPQLDPHRLDRYLQEVRDNQSLPLGVLGGAAAAAVAAGIWAYVTVLTNYQIGWMAVGVGFLVGYAVRLLGKGIDQPFGIAGGAIALLGCAAGNLMTVLLMVSRDKEIPVLELLGRLTPDLVTDIMVSTFQPMDVLFYGLAIYVGYKYAFRPIPEEDLAKLAQ